MIIIKGSPDKKEVALLFDDGPNPNITPKLLEVLSAKNILANFFLIGMRVEQSPELARSIAKAGHEIGNHTYTHKRLPQLLNEDGQQAVIDEVVKAEAGMKNAGIDVSKVNFLRPPYLDWNDDVAKIINPMYGDNIMMASLSVSDWDWGVDHFWDDTDLAAISNQASRIHKEWAGVVNNGTLLGFHDSSEHNLPGNKQFDTWMNRALPTLEAIPQIIDYLLSEGYEIKRLSDMELVKERYVDLRK